MTEYKLHWAIQTFHQKKKWKPNANTVAYFSFKEDQLDKVWTAVIWWTWTKQTIWYQFDFNWAVNISNITNSKFCCFWIKFWATKNAPNQTPTIWIWELQYSYWHDTAPAFRKTFGYTYQSNGWGHSDEFNTTSGQWYFMAYGYTGTSSSANVVAYANWNKIMDITTSLYSTANWRLWYYIDETLSELIFEDRCRTAQEVVDYFNQTKANYWYIPNNN